MISDTEIERRLGVDSYQYHQSRRKRESLRAAKTKLGWDFDDERNESSYQGHLTQGGLATAQNTGKQKSTSLRKGFNPS